MDFSTTVKLSMNSIEKSIGNSDLTIEQWNIIEQHIKQSYVAGYESNIIKTPHDNMYKIKIYKNRKEIGMISGVNNLIRLLGIKQDDVMDVLKDRQNTLRGFNLKYC